MTLNLTDVLPRVQCKETNDLLRNMCNTIISADSPEAPLVSSPFPNTLAERMGHFSLTLNGNKTLLLVADIQLYNTPDQQNGPRWALNGVGATPSSEPTGGNNFLLEQMFFTPSTVITMKGVPCRINWISPDGTIMSVTTPSFHQICGEDQCGSLLIGISNYGFEFSNTLLEPGVHISEFSSALRHIVESPHEGDRETDSSAVNTPSVLSTLGLKLLLISISCPPWLSPKLDSHARIESPIGQHASGPRDC